MGEKGVMERSRQVGQVPRCSSWCHSSPRVNLYLPLYFPEPQFPHIQGPSQHKHPTIENKVTNRNFYLPKSYSKCILWVVFLIRILRCFSCIGATGVFLGSSLVSHLWSSSPVEEIGHHYPRRAWGRRRAGIMLIWRWWMLEEVMEKS